MSWKLHGTVFRISLGILSSPENLPLDGLWRHMSYIILVNDAVSVGSVEEALISNMKLSFVCHVYWRMTHMHPNRWYVGSKHRGVCFWNDYFCVEKMTFAMASRCVAKFPSLCTSQSSGMEF